MIYDIIKEKFSKGQKMLAVLLDPDKLNENSFRKLIDGFSIASPDLVLVGSSLLSASMEDFVVKVKEKVNVRVVLFPGDCSQFTPKADAVLFLSLISGRNPEFLIGQHVRSACAIKRSGVEVISTGYILIDGGRTTSVQYVSNTMPIPAGKTELAVATAIAGEMLGNKLIYLEAGSGALNPVPASMISAVRQNVSVPLIVGGGLRSAEAIKRAFEAGADIVVVGNVLEDNPNLYLEFIVARDGIFLTEI